jgi:hypothetical protein
VIISAIKNSFSHIRHRKREGGERAGMRKYKVKDILSWIH